MKLLTALILGLFLSVPAMGSVRWIKLDGRIFETCQYFTVWNGEFAITYSNNGLPWGTRVEVLYGFHGWTSATRGETRDWVDGDGQELPAVAPYIWRTEIHRAVASRGQNWFDQLQFAIKVKLPNGQVFYDKGNDSTWGYYASNILDEAGRGCVGEDVPFRTMTVTTVERY